MYLHLRHTCWLGLLLLSLLASCTSVPESRRQEVERLNHRAFDERYSNLDSMRLYATKALRLSKGYPTGIAEAYNNLGFAAYMKQDFQRAESCFSQVIANTNNQLEQLVADVGMMKVCQRMAANKRFYDYYTRARQRINRLHEESDVLDEHNKKRLTIAESDFYMASSTYYIYMQQEEKAIDELHQIDLSDLARADSVQWVYYLYLEGSGGMCNEGTLEQNAIKEFDDLLRSLLQSRERNIVYFEGNALQSFSENLNDSLWAATARRERKAAFGFLNPLELPDSLLPTYLAAQSLRCLEQYGDFFQVSGGHRTLASAYFQRGRYADAMHELELALGNINAHSQRYNKAKSVPNQLQLYNPDDSVSTEVLWLANDSVATVPEWIARIREQLSLTFSALGNKAASDYNRNIYLDILDRTRQDKELESRYEMLESESRSMDILFIVVISIILLGIILFIYLNHRWRRRNAKRVDMLKRTAHLCNNITQSIPTDVESEAQLLEAIAHDTEADLQELFGTYIHLNIEQGHCILQVEDCYQLTTDERSLLQLIQPYLDWAVQNGSTYILLADEHKQLEKERFLHEQHIMDNKRQNLDKRTCMSIVAGITPFLDRILNELRKLKMDEQVSSTVLRQERYRYIGELVDKINEYNDILALWIKMKQGTLSLHIENFALDELFAIVGKGKRTFEQCQLTFEVHATDAIVKADKALTLFMINTLVENARKYTPAGGSVTLSARVCAQYVELSVEDTGRGLSPEDVNHILNEKVYDASLIGMQGRTTDEKLRAKKGYGFGLINCKGIIEKYRKTNPLFSVCTFHVESTLGKGSRFLFRLPCGVLRLIAVLVCVGASFCSSKAFADSTRNKPQVDSLLREASRYADSTYYSNVDGYYEQALLFADTASHYLNDYYLKLHPEGKQLMGMGAHGNLAELAWWSDNLPTDYHIVLDIRNEAAVASLALGEWERYRTNNAGYTRLYRLLSQDKTLTSFCKEMQTSASNRSVALTLLIVFVLFILVTYYTLYFRHRQMYRINLQQALEANSKALASSYLIDSVNNNLLQLPQRLLDAIYADLNEIHPVQAIAMLITDEEAHLYEPAITDLQTLTPLLRSQLLEVIHTGTSLDDELNNVHLHPLIVDRSEGALCIGAFAFIHPLSAYQSDDVILNRLILRYVAIVIYQTLVRMSHKQVDIEIAEDEKRKAIHEENRLHVQNMMLDNCLSTLKHETMYYPNRIKQIVQRLQEDVSVHNREAEKEQVVAMNELMDYYKGIFTLLSSCAARQLEHVNYNRGAVSVKVLFADMKRYFAKQMRRRSLDWPFSQTLLDVCVVGDAHLLRFLLESLIDISLSVKQDSSQPILAIEAKVEGRFVVFSYTDSRGQYTQEELNQLFYPDLNRMQSDEEGNLSGTQYLICKQIIRDHDDMNGHCGCRMNAEPQEGSGYRLWFTLPLKNN